MRWVATGSLDDEQLGRLAARRESYVRMDNGRIALLVYWPIQGTYQDDQAGARRSRRGRSARLETTTGSRFTTHCERVVEIQVDE